MVTKARLKEKVKPFVRRFRGISQIYRLAIVYLLAHEAMEVHTIVGHLGLAENLVSHHLKQLHLAGWVLKTRFGRVVTYRINEKAFHEFDRLFEDTPLGKQLYKPS